MSVNLLLLSRFLTEEISSDTVISRHFGCDYSAHQFKSTVKFWVEKLQVQPFQNYALFTNDAYPFAVLLFALLHANKQIWIAPDSLPATAQNLSQHCELLGDWQNHENFNYNLDVADNFTQTLSPLNPFEPQLVIFTSGSTGEPKQIPKCLNQFQLEITTLEKYWGHKLNKATALATISHQHIYGLLFRVLWSLSAGRCFYSQMFKNPESLLNAAQDKSAYWIASPAHLKRLDSHSPWTEIASLKTIFSSGGTLPKNAAQQIEQCGKQAVIEIYGSSETGGIGWRQQNECWQLFDGLTLNGLKLRSPYLNSDYVKLDDKIELVDVGRFILNGRADRIVKVEEKRLSLTALEQHLIAQQFIENAHTFVITKNRDIVAAVVVLNSHGFDTLKNRGRNQVIKQLRHKLEIGFEAVVLPRKWLFVNSLPLTNQGKINQSMLKNLLDFDSEKFPQVLGFEILQDEIKLNLKVPKNLRYFTNHFANYPILPGVVQLAWVEHFSKLFFAIDNAFSNMEVLKFVQKIQPNDELTLTLNWKSEQKKLYFNFSSELGTHSSGRIVYGGNQ